MKIIFTNWINIVGVFFAMLFYVALVSQFDNDLNYNIFQSLVAALIRFVCMG